MSRSYKKHPYAGDYKRNKDYANRHVRQYLKNHPDETFQFNDYKKLFDQWDICDYWFYEDWKTYWANCWTRYYTYNNWGIEWDKPDYKKERQYWEKTYKRK